MFVRNETTRRLCSLRALATFALLFLAIDRPCATGATISDFFSRLCACFADHRTGLFDSCHFANARAAPAGRRLRFSHAILWNRCRSTRPCTGSHRLYRDARLSARRSVATSRGRLLRASRSKRLHGIPSLRWSTIWAHLDQGEGQQFNASPGNLYSPGRKDSFRPQGSGRIQTHPERNHSDPYPLQPIPPGSATSASRANC